MLCHILLHFMLPIELFHMVVDVYVVIIYFGIYRSIAHSDPFRMCRRVISPF